LFTVCDVRNKLSATVWLLSRSPEAASHHRTIHMCVQDLYKAHQIHNKQQPDGAQLWFPTFLSRRAPS